MSVTSALPALLEKRSGQCGQRHSLQTVFVEVGRVEPAREGDLKSRPFLIDGGVPSRVTVSSFEDGGLAEDSFKRQAESLRCAARRLVQCVALPLVPAVAEAERAVHHQKHGLGSGGVLLEQRREIQMPDLNRTVSRIDPQIAGHSHRRAVRLVDDGEEQGIILGRRLAQPDEKVFQRGKRPVGQIRPVTTIHIKAVRLMEFAGVTNLIESFQPAKGTFHRVMRRKRRRLPIGHQLSQRLPQRIRLVRQDQFPVYLGRFH